MFIIFYKPFQDDIPCPGQRLPSLLNLSSKAPATPQVTSRPQEGQGGQKAFWNKNGSITVMEVRKSDLVTVKNTKKISLPETGPSEKISDQVQLVSCI